MLEILHTGVDLAAAVAGGQSASAAPDLTNVAVWCKPISRVTLTATRGDHRVKPSHELHHSPAGNGGSQVDTSTAVTAVAFIGFGAVAFDGAAHTVTGLTSTSPNMY